MYHTLAALHPNIEFVIEEGYLTYYTVFNTKLRLHHGDWVKSGGGVGGIYPAMLRAIYQWNISEMANLSVCGHLHQYHTGTSAGSTPFIVNGSMIGYTAHSQVFRGSGEPPIQSFCLIDKKRGLTVQIPMLIGD